MKTIGIIGAMPAELKDIRAGLPAGELRAIAGFSFYRCLLADRAIVHVCCGVGKVNAAICTQALIDAYQPVAVLNTGIAGGLHAQIKVGDIVISREVLSHDLELRLLQNYPPYCGIYPADKALMEHAADACEALGFSFFVGRIVSGDIFVSDDAAKARLQTRFHPFAVDMESAGVGQCAYRNHVPFLSVRCISDNADDTGAAASEQYEALAAKRAADVALQVAQGFGGHK